MLGRIAAAPSFLFHLSLINNVSTWHTVRKKQDIQGEVKPPPSPCPLAVYSPCWTEHGATPACSPCDQHLHRVSGRLPLWVTGAPAVVHTRETLSRDPQLLEVMSASCFPHAHFPVFSTLAPYFVITRRCSSGPGSKRQIFVVNFFFFLKTEPLSNLFVPICCEILVLMWVNSINGHCLLPSRLWGQTVRTRCSVLVVRHCGGVWSVAVKTVSGGRAEGTQDDEKRQLFIIF